MNLSRIKKLCLNENKCLIVTDRHGGQWIGVEEALFPVIGLKVDEKSLRVIWQLSDKQAGEMAFERREDLEGFLDAGMVLDEAQAQMISGAVINGIIFFGAEGDGGRVLMVKEELLAPAWVKGEWTRYQLKLTRDGAVLVTFCGLMITGVVKPMGEKACQQIQDALAGLAGKSLVDVGDAAVWKRADPERDEIKPERNKQELMDF